MVSAQYVRDMALYNKWQNEQLYSNCSKIDHKKLRADIGMFFGSILKTLNHIYLVDDAIIHFVKTCKPKPIQLDSIPFPDFDELWNKRKAFDEKLIEDANEHSAQWLSEHLVFESQRLQRRRSIPRAYYLMQMFNHQTHHRSQITTELHRMNIDYGITDLPYNPYVNY